MTASQNAFNYSFPLILQADIEEAFGFLRQALLIITTTFICFLFKIIATDKCKGILALCTSLIYEEFSELSTPATLWSSARQCWMKEDEFTCLCTGWAFSGPSSLLFLAFLPSFVAFGENFLQLGLFKECQSDFNTPVLPV